MRRWLVQSVRSIILNNFANKHTLALEQFYSSRAICLQYCSNEYLTVDRLYVMYRIYLVFSIILKFKLETNEAAFNRTFMFTSVIIEIVVN